MGVHDNVHSCQHTDKKIIVKIMECPSSNIGQLDQFFSIYETRPTLGTSSDFMWDAKTSKSHFKNGYLSYTSIK